MRSSSNIVTGLKKFRAQWILVVIIAAFYLTFQGKWIPAALVEQYRCRDHCCLPRGGGQPGAGDETAGGEEHRQLFPRRTDAAVVGAGDVRQLVVFRHHRHDVDRQPVRRDGPQGHVGPVDLGLHHPGRSTWRSWASGSADPGVMTGSEWMETRFGSGKAGELARASYTLYAVLTITAFLAYGATGMGKFGSVYLPFSEHVCAALIIGITGIYVIVGGFHGVVMVEIFQTIVLSASARS